MRFLSKSEIEKFYYYGVSEFYKVFNKDEINGFRTLINEKALNLGFDLFSSPSPEISTKQWDELRKQINYYGPIDKIIKNKIINDIAQSIIGKNFKNFGINKVRINLPVSSFSKSITPWHQDEQTWPDALINQRPITIFIPLTKTDEENGIEFALLKNKSQLFTHYGKKGIVTSEVKNFIENAQTFKSNLNIGDILVFNEFVPHRTIPNKKDQLRVSLDIRFCPVN